MRQIIASVLTVLSVVLMTMAVPVTAHSPMQVSCNAPLRPADDQDDPTWQQFLTDIEVFQACVTSDLEHHKAAAQAHQAAARRAADQWNVFVHEALNAPEDFPWPPTPAEET